MCKFSESDLKLFINSVKEENYTNEKILNDLNNILNNADFYLTDNIRGELLITQNILILKLETNEKEEKKYYLFKDKEFKFMVFFLKSCVERGSTKKITNKVANMIFEELNFSIEEIKSFKEYLGIYLNQEKNFFELKDFISDNYISSYKLDLKYNEIKDEIIREKFANYEKNLEDKAKKVKEEIIEKIEDKEKDIIEKIEDKEKDLIAIIGAFVAIFTLISVNVTFLKESDGLANPLSNLITVNLIITLGMALLIFLISPKIKNIYKFLFIVSYIIIMFVLFIVINY